jgi:Bardet-Biedl syndrome 4 protein
MAAARHNHRIHVLYVHRRFDQCASLIEAALRESTGQCEYAIHVKALIARQAGVWQRRAQCPAHPRVSPPVGAAPHQHAHPVCWCHAGQLQQSLQLFQQATALNPHNIANLKQVMSVAPGATAQAAGRESCGLRRMRQCWCAPALS